MEMFLSRKHFSKSFNLGFCDLQDPLNRKDFIQLHTVLFLRLVLIPSKICIATTQTAWLLGTTLTVT